VAGHESAEEKQHGLGLYGRLASESLSGFDLVQMEAAMAPKLDFECWMQGLGLPLGDVMRATGPIMERRSSESGVSWTELDERQVIALFVSAFREAASAAFPQRDEEVLNEALDKMLANTQMEMLATSHGNNTLN